MVGGRVVGAAISTEALAQEVSRLPLSHQRVLAFLCLFLHEVSANAAVNKMSASNLALCWAPCLIQYAVTPPRYL